jgi:hypothetical protein
MVRSPPLPRRSRSHFFNNGGAGIFARNGSRSSRSAGSYSNGYFSASGSRKKSNGLRTAMSATRSTSTKKRVTFSGNTTRARKLPNGSCCQFKKWPFGSIFSA